MDLGGAPLSQANREIGLWLDQNAVPAGSFQIPGLRVQIRIVGTDLDEETRHIREERLDEAGFLLGWKNRSVHRATGGSNSRRTPIDEPGGAVARSDRNEYDPAAIRFDQLAADDLI